MVYNNACSVDFFGALTAKGLIFCPEITIFSYLCREYTLYAFRYVYRYSKLHDREQKRIAVKVFQAVAVTALVVNEHGVIPYYFFLLSVLECL